jgi:hypothetical protein
MSVPVFHGTKAIDVGIGPATRYAYLAPLTGADEDAVAGTDTGSAIALIERLLRAGPPPSVQPGEAATLSAGQRDRLLAELHLQAFGPRISATLRCAACGEDFDIGFALPELLAHVRRQATRDVAPSADGIMVHRDLRFRLPTGADELAVAGLTASEARARLLACCLVSPMPDAPERLELAMAEVDPVLDLDLPTRCAECGTEQSRQFSIQAYCLGSLLAERRRLVEEVHVLAAAYGWGRAEILSMRRTVRREHVALLGRVARRRSA